MSRKRIVAADALGARTDMTESYVSRDSNTDVVAFDDSYTNEWLGLPRCVSQSGTASDRCQRWEVLLNIRKFVGSQARPQHPFESPMQSGYFSIITYSTDHDVPQINGKC